MLPQIFPLGANRVFRSYPGGRVLDEISGFAEPSDSSFPEDWVASTTRAINPNRRDEAEGISRVWREGEMRRFDELIAEAPEFFLGTEYVAAFGNGVAPLVKFLDSAVRLPLQCHPTVPFAQQHFGSNWGKTEAYHILGVRPDNPAPFIYLGLQNPPTRERMREMVLEQDVAALEACFERIAVEVGQTYLVPGGLPHAIGPGITMVEVMEPTDFVARFEWNCAGTTLADEAKFMGRDVEFGLDMLDFTRFSVAEIRERFQPVARRLDSKRVVLLGEPHTSSFRIEKWSVRGEILGRLDSFAVGIVLSGECEIAVGDRRWEFKRYGRFFLPFAVGEIRVGGRELEMLMIFPPGL
jgi:mannose-6-phosphate isomerase